MMKHPLRRSLPCSLVLPLALAALFQGACSSELEEDDGGPGGPLPPPYQMTGAGAGSVAQGAGGGAPGAPGGSNPDGIVNPSLNNGAGGAPVGAAGIPGAAGSPGSGGTSSAPAGAGGTAVAGAAGGGSMPATGAGGTAAGGTGQQVPDVPPGDGSCPAGALFCEDFEGFAAGALPGSAPFTPQTGGGASLSIDGTTAGQGSRSLHVNAPGNSFGYIRVNNFSPPGNNFFGRVRVRVDAFPTSPDYAHFVLVEATGAGGGLVRPVGGQYIPGQGQTALWGVGNDQGSSGDWTSWQPSVPTVSSQWICYEWQMRSADANIDVWLDEVPQPALSVSSQQRRDYNGSRFAFPTFNTIWFGWWLFQANNGTRDVWLDDIALASTRVGCGG
jgi:hypothetical protein